MYNNQEKKEALTDLGHFEFNETGECFNGAVKKSDILESMKETAIANVELMLTGELSYNDVQSARDEYQELVDSAIELAVNDILFEDSLEFMD